MPPFFKPTKPARRNAKPQAKAKRRAPRKASEPEPITKSALASAIRQALGQGTPGAWASDHLAESQRLVGFHYCAIHAKAKQCAAANVEVFEDRGGAKQKSRLKSHGQEIPENLAPVGEESALVRLLSRPHPGCSASTFLYDIAQQHDMTGSALIVKVRNRAGLPVELYVIPTGAVQGMPPTPQYPNGFYQVGHNLVGSLWRDSQGFTELRGYQALSGAIIPPEDMIVIRWPHPILRDDGYGAIAAGALWSDTALQVDQSRWAHLKNGINPSFGVTVDGDVTQQQINDALKGLDQNYAGPHNVGRPFVMPKGREITPLSMSAVEMDYIGAFTQLRDAILALHGTPGVAAGITDGGSYAAFYAALKQFITLTVQPLLDLIAGELREQLAVEFEGDGRRYVIWLTAAAIDDPEVLERRLATDISAQAITVNEIRALRGLPPRPDGDKYAGAPPAPPAGAPLGATPADEFTTGLAGVPRLGKSITKEGGNCGTGSGGFKPGNTCGDEDGVSDEDKPVGKVKPTASDFLDAYDRYEDGAPVPYDVELQRGTDDEGNDAFRWVAKGPDGKVTESGDWTLNRNDARAAGRKHVETNHQDEAPIGQSRRSERDNGDKPDSPGKDHPVYGHGRYGEDEDAIRLGNPLGEERDEIRSAIGLPKDAEFRVSARQTHLKDGTTSVAVNASGIDEQAGRYALDRTFHFDEDGNPSHVVNDHFQLENDGTGLGGRVFRSQVDELSSRGFKEIRTLGEKGTTQDGKEYVGYKVWPRMGYDGDIPDSLVEHLPPKLAHAKRLSDLMVTPEGRDWWDENGVRVDLTFDLTPGSYSRRVLEARKKKSWRSTRKSQSRTADNIFAPGEQEIMDAILDELGRQPLTKSGDGGCGTGAGGFKPGNTCGKEEGGGGGSVSREDRPHVDMHQRVSEGDIAQKLRQVRSDPEYKARAEATNQETMRAASEMASLVPEGETPTKEQAVANVARIKQIAEEHGRNVKQDLTERLSAEQLSKDTGIPQEKIERRLPKIIDKLGNGQASDMRTWARDNNVAREPLVGDLAANEPPALDVISAIDAAGSDELGMAIAHRAGLRMTESDFLTFGFKEGESSEDYARRARDRKYESTKSWRGPRGNPFGQLAKAAKAALASCYP